MIETIQPWVSWAVVVAGSVIIVCLLLLLASYLVWKVWAATKAWKEMASAVRVVIRRRQALKEQNNDSASR